MAGSIIGAAFGHGALFVGGFLGGLIASPCGAYLAARLQWIEPGETKGTALGAALGFLTAAIVAVNTLSSPVGPVLSTLLVGAGGLVAGAWLDQALSARPCRSLRDVPLDRRQVRLRLGQRRAHRPGRRGQRSGARARTDERVDQAASR